MSSLENDSPYRERKAVKISSMNRVSMPANINNLGSFGGRTNSWVKESSNPFEIANNVEIIVT